MLKRKEVDALMIGAITVRVSAPFSKAGFWGCLGSSNIYLTTETGR
jgi:hypothetical protein